MPQMTSDLSIGYSGDADAPARIAIVRACWHQSYEHLFSPAEIDAVFDGGTYMTGGWTHRRTADAGTFSAATAGGMVGWVNVGLLEPRTGEVAALYVAPQWQGRGVGHTLWAQALEALREHGVERVEVWTLRDSRARAFYEGLGCEFIGESTFAIDGHEAAAVGYATALG